MTTSSKLDENWTKTTDAAERRRIQNRLAQRNYRNNIKQRLRQLEQLDQQLDKPFLKSVNLNAATLSRDEHDEDDVLHQQQNTTTYPVSQSVVTQPDDNCYWLSSQNDISVSGQAEIQMDRTTQIEPSQDIFGLNTPHTNRSPSPQPQSQHYNYFGVAANPSPPLEQHATLTYDRESSGQTAPTRTQLQYHSRHASAVSKPDTATQSGFSVGSMPATQVHSHANSHSQPQVYRMQPLPSSEKEYKLNAVFGLKTPHTNGSPSPQPQSHQYNYFGVAANPSPPLEQHATLTYDRDSSGQTAPTRTQLQHHNRHASAVSKPDAATQSGFSVGSVPTRIHSPKVYRRHTLPSSEEEYKLHAGSPLRYMNKNDPVLQYTTSAANPASCTPLHQAAANGHLQIVRFLLLKGANLTAPNEEGQTVLHLAAERGHEAVIEHALSQDVISQFTADGHVGGGGAKAFIDGVDDQGFTALHRAAAGGHEECVRILVEAGAEIESTTRPTVPSSGAFSASKEEAF